MAGIEDRSAGLKTDLVGFYGSCTVFGIAAALAAFAFIVGPDLFGEDAGMTTVGWIAVVVCAVSAFTTFWFLRRTRLRTGG